MEICLAIIKQTAKKQAKFEQEKRREAGLNLRLILPCSDRCKICKREYKESPKILVRVA
jgi:hypothetical protein